VTDHDQEAQMSDAAPESENPEQPETGPVAGGEDELKRKFREALEHKRGQQANSNASGTGKDPSKAHATHGPAGSRRSFRRKSGG
jgi:hypothetical protein